MWELPLTDMLFPLRLVVESCWWLLPRPLVLELGARWLKVEEEEPPPWLELLCLLDGELL